jgi:hypothetical protein
MRAHDEYGVTAAPRPRPDRPTGSAHGLHRLQQLAGNRAVSSLLPLQRTACCDGCATGSGCADEAEPVQRTPVVQRDESPPGPPESADQIGLKCGPEGCELDVGKGQALNLPGDWSRLGPSLRRSQADPTRPPSCPPHRWNWFWVKCCGPEQLFDPDGNRCVSPPRPSPEQEIDVPPAPEPDLGDFPVPDGGQAYA